jgi:hypothetical protein
MFLFPFQYILNNFNHATDIFKIKLHKTTIPKYLQILPDDPLHPPVVHTHHQMKSPASQNTAANGRIISD